MNNNPTPQRSDQSGRPARRSRRPGLVRRVALAAVCLAGAGGLMLAATGTAFAVVSQSSPQWEELGPLAYTDDLANQVTAVYTIQNVAEPGTQLLEDNSNNMNQGYSIDVWSQTEQQSAQDPMGTGPYGPITQANELWEFIPDNPADGTQITQEPGQLINRQSGLCLDIAHNNGADGAAIDQWPCNLGQNQQWVASATPDGNYNLVPMLDYSEVYNGTIPSLGIGTGSTCTVNGDGDTVTTRTTGTAGNLCDEWNIQQASYDFATYAMQGVDPNAGTIDTRTYQCVQGDHIRLAQGEDNIIDNGWLDSDNLSTDGIVDTMYPYTGSTPPTYVPGGTIYYGPFSDTDGVKRLSGASSSLGHVKPLSSDSGSGTAQVMLYCDPATTTP
jgi:hypothetical protein